MGVVRVVMARHTGAHLREETGMKVTKHGDYLYKLTRLGFVNCYLVREGDGLMLVDASFPGSAKGILAAAQDIGAPIMRIVLTHAHIDHAGSVDALRDALPDVEVCAGTREARFLAGDRSLDDGEPHASLRGGYVTLAQPVTRTLEPGDRVGSLEVHASPGHTPGHIALFDTRDQTLIAGDAWVTKGGLAVVGKWTWFPLPAMGTWNKATALQSAKALRALNPSRLAVGHGKVLESPVAQMDAAIRAY